MPDNSRKVVVLIAALFALLFWRLSVAMISNREQVRHRVYTDRTFMERFEAWGDEGILRAERGGVYADLGKIGGTQASQLRLLAGRNLIESKGNRHALAPGAVCITNPYLYLGSDSTAQSSILGRDNRPLVLSRWAKGRLIRRPVNREAFGPLLGNRAPLGNWGLESVLARLQSKTESDIGCLVTTIDPVLQKTAHDSLKGQPGAAVVIDVKTGDILALASEGESNSAQRTIHRALEKHEAPGSTFKLLVAMAALESEAVYADDVFECAGGFRPQPGAPYILHDHEAGRAGFHGHNPGGKGDFTLIDAMAVSCNVTFAQVGLLLGEDRLQDAFAHAGFDAPLPMVPEIASSGWNLAPGRFRSEVRPMTRAQLAQTAIGQRDVRLTPLHLAAFVAGLGNGGAMMKPRLVSELRDEDGRTIIQYPPEPGVQVCSPGTARQVVRMMEAVMSRGTGRELKVPGLSLAGKTGTAQTLAGQPHSWFAGLAPAEAPRWAVVVLVEHGGYGSRAAGPAAMEILSLLRNKIDSYEDRAIDLRA